MRLETREHCPACGAEGFGVAVDLPFDRPPIRTYLDEFYGGHVTPDELADERYVVCECRSCELLFQRCVPDAELLGTLYGGGSDEAKEAVTRSRGLAARRSFSFQVEQCVKYFGGVPADVRVLDYGMGWGLWVAMALAYGCDVSGAELSASRIDAAPRDLRIYAPGELPPDTFHFINTEQVFEHLVEPAAVLAELTRALRPGGVLRISVPNGSNVLDLLRDPDWSAPKASARSLNAIAPLEHINCFNHRSLSAFAANGSLRSFRYPLRQYLDPWERARFIASAFKHAVRPPRGTMLLFQRPT
jgi:SAM-dependent methyltransferase